MTLHFSTAQYGLGLMGGFMVFAIIITFSISYYDAVIHGLYILPEQRACWDTKTTNPICLEVYKNVGVPVGDNADLPNAYWKMLNNVVTIIGLVIAGIWLLMTFVLSRMNGEYPDKTNIFFALVIGATISILPMCSWGDYFYFIILNQPLPDTLPWLDHAGFFQYILQITGDQHVTLNDVYIAMGSGIAGIAILWTPILIAFAMSKKSKVSDLIFQD